MGLPIFVVDSFTSEAFRGNPAAVVLGHGDDGWMQQVAAEMRHSETAFVRDRTDGFDASREVEFLGPEAKLLEQEDHEKGIKRSRPHAEEKHE